MATNAFKYSRVTSYSHHFGSAPIRLQDTVLRLEQDGITFEFNPVWVRVADPNGCRSVNRRVKAKPIRYSLDTDTIGSDLLQTEIVTFSVQPLNAVSKRHCHKVDIALRCS